MSQLLKDFIKSEIHPMMKELGYRKKANYFWRKNDVFVFTINFQSSQWNFEGRDELFLLIVVCTLLRLQKQMEMRLISQNFL